MLLHLHAQVVDGGLKIAEQEHQCNFQRGGDHVVSRLEYVCMFDGVDVLVVAGPVPQLFQRGIGDDLIDVHIDACTGPAGYSRDDKIAEKTSLADFTGDIDECSYDLITDEGDR